MIIIFPFLLLPSRQCPVMQFQEFDQLWSWHCQRAQPTQHYSSPISTRPSPSTALFSLQPLILPQGRKTVFQTPGLLTSISETVRCSLREPRPVPGFQYKPVLLADLRYLRPFIQPPLCDSSLTSWAPFLYHHWPSTGSKWGQLSTQTNPRSPIIMSSRRKASTPCMIRPDQTMVELDDDTEDSHVTEVNTSDKSECRFSITGWTWWIRLLTYVGHKTF